MQADVGDVLVVKDADMLADLCIPGVQNGDEVEAGGQPYVHQKDRRPVVQFRFKDEKNRLNPQNGSFWEGYIDAFA